jgi:hypothetical protein
MWHKLSTRLCQGRVNLLVKMLDVLIKEFKN